MSVYGTSLLVWVDLLQGAFSQTETHIHGEKVRHKIATKTEPAGNGGHCLLVHTALWRAPHAFGKWAIWHDESIVGDGVRGRFRLSSGGWGRGKWSRFAVQFVKFELLKVRVIERAEKRSTPQG
jgi:hypothetical protein